MEQRIIMKRIDQILSHPVFREQFALLQEAEKDRIFCRHTMEHFLDVARLMYIYNLEDQAGFSKEMIYAAGLLHDIGRYEQMEKGTPHHLAGARLAERILTDCDFSLTEQKSILAAIRSHRVLRKLPYFPAISTVRTNSRATAFPVLPVQHATGRRRR